MRLPKFLAAAENTVVWIGAIALMLLGILICVAVGARLLGGVIRGNAEIGEMLIIVVASTSLVAATFSGAHPYVHMLVDRLSSRSRGRLIALVTATAALFWAVAAWVNGKVTIENHSLVEHTELLRISLIPFRIVWVAALVAITLVLAIRAIKALTDRPSKDA